VAVAAVAQVLLDQMGQVITAETAVLELLHP